MKWFTDENIPWASTTHLKRAGLDVVSVLEIGAGMSDRDVLAYAVNETRALLTFDRDFGELIFQQGLSSPPAVVYLRVTPLSSTEPAQLLLRVLDRGDITGNFFVLDRENYRTRPLP